MFEYIDIPPLRIIGMAIFITVMLSFIIWVTGFRKRTRELIGNRNYFFILSGIIILFCIGSLIVKGVNWGLDFTGGTAIEITVPQNLEVKQVREAIGKFAGQADNPGQFLNPRIQMAERLESEIEVGAPSIKQPESGPIPKETPEETSETPSTGESKNLKPEESKTTEETVKEVPATGGIEPEPAEPERGDTEKTRRCIIQIKEISSPQVDELVKFLDNEFKGPVSLLRIETIGPTIGKELKSKATIALLIALFAQLIYITFRFGTQLRYGIAADIALIHDLVVMVGLYSFFDKPFDSTFLAALLTIIGYSVMDTVVVFDRVRENLRLFRGKSYAETVNLSLNQVMTRTSATSFTTILTIFALFYFGGATLHDFAFALLIGAIAGTYSSLFIASPLVVIFDDYIMGREKAVADAKRERLEHEAVEKAVKAKKKKGSEEEMSGDYPSPEEIAEVQEEAAEKKKATRKRR